MDFGGLKNNLWLKPLNNLDYERVLGPDFSVHSEFKASLNGYWHGSDHVECLSETLELIFSSLDSNTKEVGGEAALISIGNHEAPFKFGP